MSETVTIIQEEVYHYRVPFFRELQRQLHEQGVELALAYEKGGKCRDLDDEPWTLHTPCKRFGKLCWQNLDAIPASTRLVIFPQMVRYPYALIEQSVNWIRNRKTAFWGHGKYFDPAWDGKASERFKAWLSKHVDWWFAYNERSARVLRDELGYPADRITSVMNAIDTRAMRDKAEHTTPAELEALRQSIGCRSDNVAVYTGTLYSSKRIDFLLEAARRVRKTIEDFELIVIGSGEDSRMVGNAAAENPWIHHVGRQNDQDKVPYWMLAKLLLIPGAVGLVVIDSMALGLPMVTTAYPFHGPEIDYLRHGENGWLVDDWQSVDAYADAVIHLLSDETQRGELAAGAMTDGGIYTIDTMANRFADGIRKALAADCHTGF